MHDVGGRPSREIVKEIYDSHIKKGLAQAVGSGNVVEIPTGLIGQEVLLHKQTGRPHRSARAVYFGDGPLGEAFDECWLIRRAKRGGPVDLRPKKLVH